VPQHHRGQQREDHRQPDVAGDPEAGQEDALAGQQQRRHQPVQPPLCGWRAPSAASSIAINRSEDQHAGQVSHAQVGQVAGDQQAHEQRRQRRQLALDHAADPVRDRPSPR